MVSPNRRDTLRSTPNAPLDDGSDGIDELARLHVLNALAGNSAGQTAHHAKYTDAEVISALEAEANVNPTGSWLFDSVLLLTNGLQANVISERTAAAGVTIDGVLVKDGEVDGVDISVHEIAYNAHVAASGAHHARQHSMGQTLDHTATAWRMFYSDAGGDVDELALGASGTVLTSQGASSNPVFSAPDSPGMVLAHSSDSETGPLTSSTAADAVAVTGLSIPADHGIVFEFNYRMVNPAGSSRTANFGFEVNTTTLFEATLASGIFAAGSTNASTTGVGSYRVTIPPRATNYTRGAQYQLLGAVMADGATPLTPNVGTYFGPLARTNGAPVATVTSLTLRYICQDNASDTVDLYINNVRVWELPN